MLQEELFDDYADDFDRHLGALRYDVPGCLLAMLPLAHFNRCIDLGCGTGLAGARVRARCTQLEGVDLPLKIPEAPEPTETDKPATLASNAGL